VLLGGHGVFTIGDSARAAVKAAVMCEDVARTVHYARTLGDPVALDRADIDRLYERYQNAYGQK
jgi:L-ribulose-5-phosphate 4-epimerase